MTDHEKEKYIKIYNNTGVYTKNGKIDTSGAIRKKYGHENSGKLFMRFIERIRPTSVIDIGCGHNEFANLVKDKLNIETVGVDFACPSADIMADADALPVGDKEFDLVTSFDTLEHITEEKIDQTLLEFRRVAHRFILFICLRGSLSRIDGGQLHVCKKSSDWWLSKIHNHCHDVCQISHYKKKMIVGKTQANKLFVYGLY
jgi:ubiquinone/menaquinone biosynthesis C-methylase UbiE